MKLFSVIVYSLLLMGCKAEIESSHFQSSPTIKVQTQTMAMTTEQGEITVYGVVESAKTVDLNVEFSAPVEDVLVEEGQAVRAGQPLLVLDTGKLALSLTQTQQVLAQARIQKENAALQFERVKTLKDRDAIALQQYDEASFALDEAEARIRELKARIAVIERDVKIRVLRSPMDAVVDQRHVEAGQSVTAFQPLITLQSKDRFKVSVYVSEQHLRYLKVGNPGRIKTVAGDFESGIHSISATTDPHTGNYEIKLMLTGGHNGLKPGMTAEVRLASSEIPRQLVIPESALVAWHGQHVVYAIENGKAQRRIIDVVLGFDDRLLVGSGVAEGDEIVVSGARQLTQGSPVEIVNE